VPTLINNWQLMLIMAFQGCLPHLIVCIMSGRIAWWFNWQGDFGDKDGKKSIVLEAVANDRLHLWHAFFGLLGSNNNLNVLN